jgi:hypothetical protein
VTDPALWIDVNYSPEESIDWRLVDASGKEAVDYPVSLIIPFQVGSSITLPSYSTLRLAVGEGSYQEFDGLVFNIGSQWWKIGAGGRSAPWRLGCRFANAKPEPGSGTHRPMWTGALAVPAVPLPLLRDAGAGAPRAPATR